MDDVDGFLSERTEMFTYFRHPLIKTDALELASVDIAFEDEERKKAMIQNLQYDLKEVGKMPTCEVCALKHAPIKTSDIEVEHELERLAVIQKFKDYEK